MRALLVTALVFIGGTSLAQVPPEDVAGETPDEGELAPLGESESEPDGREDASGAAVEEEGEGEAPPAEEAEDTRGALERAAQRVAELEALLDGTPLPGTRIESLFSVDVSRPDIREAERERLRAAQELARAEDEDDESADEGEDEEGAAEGDAQVPAGEAEEPSDLHALEARATELRLVVLGLPEEELEARLSALAARQSIDERIAESEAAAAEADDARRRAEEASERANAAALAARNQQERMVAEGRSLLEGEQAAIAERLGEAARARQAGHEEEEARLAVVEDVRAALRDEDIDASHADNLYDSLVGVLVETRSALRAALERTDELPSPASIPAGARSGLGAELSSTRRARREAEDTLARMTREHVRALSSMLHDGNELRLELLREMSAERRDALVGFGDEGRDQVRREVEQLELMTRATTRRISEDIGTYPARLWALASEPATRGLFGSLLFVVIGSVVLWRRREALGAALGKRVARSVGHKLWRGWVGRVYVRVEALIGSGIAIGGALLAMQLGLRLDAGAGFALCIEVAIAWGIYRLAVRLVNHELSTRSTHVRPEQRAPLERTVRRLGRFVLISYLLLDASSRIVGKGTLHSYLFRALAVAGVILAALTFFRWRKAVDRYYLETHPDGRLVGALQDGRPHIHLPGTLAALVVITVDWAVETVQGLAGGFALGRRILAFFSQRKVTSADATDGTQVAPDGLPFELAPEADACIDHYPEMTELMERANSERGGAFALVGECGSGKTLWLEEAARRADALSLMVPGECHDAEEFARWLPEALGHEGTLDTLAAELAEGPSRTILLDECQNLFLRRIGGSEPFRQLTALVGRTQHRVVWCCSFTLHAWSYLRSAAAGQEMFEGTISLPKWSESTIEKMCMRRAAQAGLRVDFGSLVDGALTGRPRLRAVQRAREELFRLLWHYSDGNPRVALHYWQRSLFRMSDDRWGSKIFAKPDTERLEQMHIETLFVLAAVTLHKDLSATELADTLRISHARSVSLLQLLETRSLLVHAEGRYHLSTHWYREVVVRLRRRRLLFS